ncbi:MAG: 50S ribosomal protein L32 [Spirulinaceae cyanobacterium SM2_1_0]|nr:50S ribosomal protein L32 [Spirulinaceae cyanobacterium SM2_1_0]
MAVPKKKTSNARRDRRRAHWNRKAALAAQKALSQGKSVLTGRSNSFVYEVDEDDEDDEE